MSKDLVKISDLPDLHKMEVSPQDLSSDYWTPETEGEFKVGVILEIKEETYTTDDEQEITLPCVIMLSQEEDKSYNTIRNGSKRLVATVETAVDMGRIEYGITPVKITFRGKKKNKNNAYMSDRWSVQELMF